MSDVSSPALDAPAPAEYPIARRQMVQGQAQNPSDRDVLDHYFKRIDPKVAASFTPAQQDAIRSLLGAREIAEHTIEVRHSIPLLGKRLYYLVFLFGREQRSLARLYSQGGRSNLAFYLGLGALFFSPVLILLYAGIL